MTRQTLTACAALTASFFVPVLQASASAATSYPSASCTSAQGTTTCDIEPSATDALGSGITPETNSAAFNHTVAPASPRKSPVLVVILGGATSKPSGYEALAAEAASLGYYAVDLRYDNKYLVGDLCRDDDECFTEFRGMTLFGSHTAVPGVNGTFAWTQTVTAANSVVNRLVNLLDTLGGYDPAWSKFLVNDAASPYRSLHHPNGVLPAWNLIVASGHSEGSGDAAFLSLNVPGVRRAALLSGPDDYYTDAKGLVHSASWIVSVGGNQSVSKIWGARNAGEGPYGDCTSLNWKDLGLGASAPGVASCAIPAWEVDVGDGSNVGAADGARFLRFTNYPYGTSLYCHDSTAADDNRIDGSSIFPFSPNRTGVWDYLLTADFTD
ncbi:MAG TPA: hypothetical protein VGI39_37050 [Polyangiaceae bacterium]|jgi:hypothetical protein